MPPPPLPKIPYLYSLSLILLVLAGSVQAYVSYANDFVDPDFIIGGNFANNTRAAQNTIIEWAKETAAGGPWGMLRGFPFIAYIVVQTLHPSQP